MTIAATQVGQAPFWGRQFAPAVTARQRAFDVAAGIALPLACLAADPIVFRETSFGAPLLGGQAVGAYVAMGTGMTALALWLTASRPAGLLAGALAASGLFALGLGLLLLPFSILGAAMLGLGLLGLSPFLTAFVLVRNAVRAGRSAGRTWAASAGVGFALAAATPLGAQWGVHRVAAAATEQALSPDDTEARRGVERLQRLRYFADADALAWAYRAEVDPSRRSRLAAAYWAMTGVDVEHRLAVLLD